MSSARGSMSGFSVSAPYWSEATLFANAEVEELNFLQLKIAPRSDASVEERGGQLMASAVFHGALLNRASWKSWLEAATTSAWLDQGLVWVDLAPIDPLKSGPDSQTHRWFADPITRLLLAHWHSDGLGLKHFDPDLCLRAFFGPSDECWADRLLRHASRHWRLRIPPILVAHALDLHRAVPPQTDDWQRILAFGREIKRKNPPEVDNPEPAPAEHPAQGKRSSYDPEIKAFSES